LAVSGKTSGKYCDFGMHNVYLAEGGQLFLRRIRFWPGRTWWGGPVLASWMMHVSREEFRFLSEDSSFMGINSGVTRATRVAKFLPGQTVRVEVIDYLPNWNVGKYPTVKDKLP
jgi:hypothetical protein